MKIKLTIALSRFKERLFLTIMKTFIFLFCTTVFSFNARDAFSQEKIKIDHDQLVTVDQVFKIIKKQTDYRFIYPKELFSEAPRVQLKKGEIFVTKLLEQSLTNNKFYFEVANGSTIVIKENLKPVVVRKEVQSIEISGKVVDVSGQPLIGANVLEKGTTNGIQTDIDGNFKLTIKDKNAVLVVSYMGFLVKEVPVNSKTNITIILEADATSLDDVVVVGFGKQKKESVVSSISTIKGEELKLPTRSLSNNLAGRVSGIIAVQRSGEPGYDNSEFWIRGISSFKGGTTPLVLVDGIPRNMNDIEPDEIETFSILKDAASTAIYGAEGANGVILVTSKRGKAQKTLISYRGEYSLLQPTRLPEFLGAVDFMKLYNEGLSNEGKQPKFSDEVIARTQSGLDPDLYPDVQWLDLLRNTTNNQRHTLNFRGGGEKARFFISGAYFGESGLFKSNPNVNYENNIGLKRYNLRSNVDFDVTNTTLLRVDLSGQYLETNYPGVGTAALFRNITLAPPNLYPMIFSDGTFASHPTPSDNRSNPYNLLMESGYAKEWRSSIQSKVAIEQKLDVVTDGLMVKGVVSYDSDSRYVSTRTKRPAQFIANGRDVNGDLMYSQTVNETVFGEPVESNTGNKNIYLETSLNYGKTFDGKHLVGGMLLYYKKETQLSNEALAFRKEAYIGRATYMFDRRYSIEANFGITGSEAFSKGNRYGFFPAVGVAWNASNESFFTGIKDVINDLKIRASIGRTGNDNTGGDRFLYRGTFVSATGYSIGIGGSGPLNGIGGYAEGRFAAPTLSWEIEDKRNIGIDLGLFNNNITLQADYFDNSRYDILLQRNTVSASTGFRQAPWQNFGKVTNKGVDLTLNGRKQLGDFVVGLRGTFTFARNKITEFDEVKQPYSWMNVTGTRLNIPNIYIAEGLYTENDFDISVVNGANVYTLKDGLAVSTLSSNNLPGDIKYKDLNGDGKIDQFDQTRNAAMPTVPEIVYGFGFNVEYKNFYLNGFFQGAGNVSTVLGGSNPEGFFPFTFGVEESSVRKEGLNRWTVNNPSQDVMFPRQRSSTYFHNRVASTWWLRDASYIRLKNVEIGYNVDKSLLNKLGLTTGRIYVMGNNLYVWDKIKMWDPEIGNANAGLNYPLPRTITFGLELTL
ncbi:SusC/RagA family TonB-linked outer membrane protein [Flavobacterium sp. MAHUQ-51]|uniref:SusC/RagA family TonB-linked outer membrane protein n=1 Tax=Flavobacterium sp. GCM10022190 TaxID=3252639 RepID=UPI003605AFCE